MKKTQLNGELIRSYYSRHLFVFQPLKYNLKSGLSFYLTDSVNNRGIFYLLLIYNNNFDAIMIQLILQQFKLWKKNPKNQIFPYRQLVIVFVTNSILLASTDQSRIFKYNGLLLISEKKLSYNTVFSLGWVHLTCKET